MNRGVIFSQHAVIAFLSVFLFGFGVLSVMPTTVHAIPTVMPTEQPVAPPTADPVLHALSQWDSVAGVLSPARYQFTQNLFVGISSPEVHELQKYLNQNGFAVATEGPGSPGQETNYFGTLTERALARFQAVHNVMPAAGYFGPLTRERLKRAE